METFEFLVTSTAKIKDRDYYAEDGEIINRKNLYGQASINNL